MTKYAPIPEFGQFVEYITQAPEIDGFCDVVINQVDLSEQPIIEAAEIIKADYEKVAKLQPIPKLDAKVLEKIKAIIEKSYSLDTVSKMVLPDDPIELLKVLIELKTKPIITAIK